MLEIHVDIRRFAPFFRDEAFEQQGVASRINGGDAQHITDCGIGSRLTTLAENVLTTGIADDAVHREEIGRVFHAPDQAEFVVQAFANLVRNPLGIGAGCRFPCQGFQSLLGRLTGHGHFIRILVGQIIERELAAFHDIHGAGDRFGVTAKQPGHLLWWFEIAVCVPLPDEPDVVFADEAHRIKNRDAGRTRAVRTLIEDRSRGAVLLTGTPLRNNGGEGASLIEAILPGARDRLAGTLARGHRRSDRNAAQDAAVA